MRLLPLLLVLMFVAVPAAAQSVRDFQLPPDPESTQSSQPQAQGPTDLEGQNRAAPRVIATPTPTPQTTPTAQPTPRATATPTSTPSRQPTRAATSGPTLPVSDRPVPTREVLSEPTRTPEPRAASDGDQASPDTASAIDNAAEQPASESTIAFPDSEADQPTSAAPTRGLAQSSSTGEALPWAWIALAAIGVLALLAIAFLFLRRKRSPQEAKPKAIDISGQPLREHKRHTILDRPDTGSVEVEVHAVALRRSVMNASISYRLTLINRGREPITLIDVAGDVTTAHGRVPADQQLAHAEQSFPELHRLDRLGPGQRSTINGELRLPLREVRALRQGSVPVFVPLMRLTVRAANMKPRAYTFVIGTRTEEKGARPNPFRLDEPPRSYAQLTTRALA